MKKLLLTLSLILTMGFSAAGVSAQVQAPDLGDTITAEDIPGLQSAYDRTFMVDFEAMMDASPESLESMDTSAMMRSVSIQGYTFDSEDNAKSYIDMTRDSFGEAKESDPETFDGVEVEDLEGFDNEGITVTMDMPDLGVAMTINAFVDGNNVMTVMVMDSDSENSQSVADELTQFIIDAEIENEEVTFNADGTSTGGVFDLMPTADDEIVADLPTATDTELYASGGE